MLVIKLEINIQIIQDEILTTFQEDPYAFPSLLSILEFLDVKIESQWQEQLSNFMLAGEIEKYNLLASPFNRNEYYRTCRTVSPLVRNLKNLSRISSIPLLERLYLDIDVLSDNKVRFEPTQYVSKNKSFNIRNRLLKTGNRNYKIRGIECKLDSEIFSSIIREIDRDNSNCNCELDLLMPYIDGSWDWLIRFVCKSCGKVYFCDCFRKAIEIYYEKVIKERQMYLEGNWYKDNHGGNPYKQRAFIEVLKEASFREEICHLCRSIPCDVDYASAMYASPVKVNYGPYIVRTAIEEGISQRDAENKIRDELGIVRIGEGWVSETKLLKMTQGIFENEKVIHQASPEWLGRQRLDIFIPNYKIAIEYQGKQHFQPVERFGGEEAYLKNQERDKRKAELCQKNGVALIYFRYDEKLTLDEVRSRILKVLNKL